MKAKSKRSAASSPVSTRSAQATDSPGSSRELKEIYLENNRLRERVGRLEDRFPNVQQEANDECALLLENSLPSVGQRDKDRHTECDLLLIKDRLSQLQQDNGAFKLKLNKGKRQRYWMYLLLFIFLVVLVALAVGLGVILMRPADQAPLSGSMLQPLAVDGDDSVPSALRKYYFNVGLRNDYRLQECQGPQLKRSFPDMDYALLGYNVLKGYPLAVGHDPGFTLPIFSADYRAGGQTADCRYSTPKGIILIPDVSCITSFTSEIIETKYAFSKSLETTASVSGGGWGASFSASFGYKTSSSEISTGKSVFIISKASCNYYYMRLLEDDAPPFHPVFMKWILKLHNSDQDADYFKFFERYGTHFLSEVKFGASFTYEHKMSSQKYETAKSNQVNVAVQASYSGLFSVSGGFSMESSQREEASKFQQSVTTRTITIGAAPPSNGDAMTWASTVKESPVPVSYSLESIDRLFSDTFMDTPSTRRYRIDYRRIAEKIKSLRRKYCELLKNSGLVDNCEDLQPGLPIANTMLYSPRATEIVATSAGKCVEECVKRTDCVAITFCSNCNTNSPYFNICNMFKENGKTLTYLRGSKHESFDTTIIAPALKAQLVLYDTGVSGIERSQSNGTDATTTKECFSLCLSDLYCVAFTFCECPTQVKKCNLYSGGHLSLFYKEDSTTHFISRQVTDVEEAFPTTTTTTTTSTSPASSTRPTTG